MTGVSFFSGVVMTGVSFFSIVDSEMFESNSKKIFSEVKKRNKNINKIAVIVINSILFRNFRITFALEIVY